MATSAAEFAASNRLDFRRESVGVSATNANRRARTRTHGGLVWQGSAGDRRHADQAGLWGSVDSRSACILIYRDCPAYVEIVPLTTFFLLSRALTSGT